MNPGGKSADEGTRLFREYSGNAWLFWIDSQKRDLIDRIERFLRGEGDTSPFILIGLYGASVRLRTDLEVSVPTDLKGVVEGKIRGRILKDSEKPTDPRHAFSRFEYRDEDERTLMSPLVSFYEYEREKKIADQKKEETLNALKNKKFPQIISEEGRHLPWLMSVLLDSEVLTAADDLLESAPEIHFRFYQNAIKSARDRESKVASFEALTRRTEALLKITKDKSSIKRLEWILKGIKDNLPKETIPKLEVPTI